MAATDALPVARKNAAYRVYFPIRDVNGDLVTGAAGLDSERSLDGATFADCTNEATEIGSSGIYYLELTAAEMNADNVSVNVKTSTTDAKTTTLIFYPEEAGDVRVKMTALGLDVFLGAFPELGILDSGTAQSATATTLRGRAGALLPDSALGGWTIWAWGADQGYWQITTNTGHVASTDTHTVPTWDVTPSGLITYIVWGTASGATAPMTAADVWAATPRTLTAGTNIALAKGTGVTGFTDIDAAGIRTAVGLASANLDTQLADLPTNTEMEARTLTAALIAKLTAHLNGVLTVIVGSGSTTTALVLNATTGINGGAPSSVNDHYNGRVFVFLTGTLAGQATSISDYVGSTKTATVVTTTSAAQAGDTAVMV